MNNICVVLLKIISSEEAMKNAVLLSVHPEHIANILSGRKKFEYRKIMPAQSVSHIVLYSTNPVKMIVAVAEVSHRIADSLTQVWHQTSNESGITHEFFLDYFSESKKAACFALGNVYELSNPIKINELLSCKVPPQSFCYLDPRDIDTIFKMAPSVPAFTYSSS